MSHAYPLARSGRDALTGADLVRARTREEARRACPDGQPPPESLLTEWLTLSAEDAAALEPAIARAVDAGFVQRYEDARSNTVLAVTFWSLAPAAGQSVTPEEKPGVEHTDDLYFRNGRTRKRRRPKPADPAQFELFSGPDQKGYERRDPDNPRVILTEEEGDGTSFGG